MKHINTTICECGNELTIQDKTTSLQPVKDKRFFGGNVTAFAHGVCKCGKEYRMNAMQTGNTWKVVSLHELENPTGPVLDNSEESEHEDEFEEMSRDDLKSWLDERNVEYTQNWGEKRLRELCREYQISESI